MPAIAPDGRWLAYVSNESGRDEVYVQPFPESGPRVQISTDGGTEPAWAPSGRELFYRQSDKMMVVEVETDQGVQPSRPKFLLDVSRYRASSSGVARSYDVRPNGQRFLMIEELEPEPMPDHLVLVVNWFDELRSRFADE